MKRIFTVEAYNKRKDFHHIFAGFIFVVMILGKYAPSMWYIQLAFWGLWFLDAMISGCFSKK